MNYKAIANWATSRDTGASSKCIARHLMGLDTDGSYPHDADDFGRCERLLVAIPELRPRLGEMASVNRYWATIAPRWDEIKSAPDQNAAIRSLVSQIEKNDPNHIDLGNGVSMRIGVSI